MALPQKYKFYILIALILAGVGYFVFNSFDNTLTTASIFETVFKCPADYSNPEDLNNDEEYRADIDVFITEYTEKNPNATEKEMMAERDRLFIENGCINRYFESKEDYPDWCPLSEQEIIATLEYMRGLDAEHAMDIMRLLADRKCLKALQELNQVIMSEIESGRSRDTQP